MIRWIALLVFVLGFWVAASVRADDNVREVQTKLSEQGFYSGQIDGAYSSDLSAALSRYQIRKGLPITGQLDVETSKSLGAKPAVGPGTTGGEQSSETWRRLRKSTSTRVSKLSSPRGDEAAEATKKMRSATMATAPPSSENAESPSSRAMAFDSGSPSPEFNTERLRDYVAAFVLAGLDKSVGAETEFFADRVEYYDSGTMDRERIREDLRRYDERWPERHFWVAGAIDIEPQSANRVRVTFPLGFKLRNGNRQSSGKVDKTLVLEPSGDDFEIVAVNERKID